VSRPLPIVERIMGLDSSALKGSVAFTGRLACMTRAEAFEVVRQHSGAPSQAVTKRTNLLIVGELGWPLLDDGRPSNKLSRATSYGIPVVSERRFLEWIGRSIPDSFQKTYSGEQLAALSKMSAETVQELAHSGYWMREVVVSVFATWQARVRSPSCLPTEFDYPKSFEA
jgi:BRCT domain type II-containing protein